MFVGAFAALAAGACASAASLAADSLLCESADPLQFVSSQDDLKGRSASEVIEQAKAVLAVYKFLRPGLGLSSERRMAALPTGEEGIISVASYCIASGAKAMPANVVERRAEQGLVKVQTVFEGRRVERWAFASALTD